jgi:hypothetical protein
MSVASNEFLKLLFYSTPEKLAEIYLLVDEFDDIVGMQRLPFFHKG